MKINRTSLLLFLLLPALLLSACGVAPAATWPGLTASKDTAYVDFGNGVFAVNLQNGTLKWRFPATAVNGKNFYAAPVLTSDDHLIVGDFSNTLYGVDLNGKQLWTFDKAKSGYVGGSLATSNGIYAPNGDNVLYSLNLQGVPGWTFGTQHALWSEPVTDNTQIYLSSMDHNLYAIRPSDGKQVWVTNLGGAINSSPTLSSDGILYVGTLGKQVLAIKASSGQILWKTSTDDAVWGKITLQNSSLFFGDISGKIYSLNASDGKTKWSVPNQGGQIIGGAATLTNSFVFGILTSTVNNGVSVSNLVNVDPQGKILWNRPINGKLYTTPILANDRLLVAIMEGDYLLAAYDLNGNPLWTFVAPK